MIIRLEQPNDWREVENLTREAFWNVYRPGCQEHFVLNQYRNDPAFIPELDLVMEEEGRIIGHVMFSKAEIILSDGTPFPSWTFGPISIHPDYKRKGYGLKLLQYALEKARAMGIGLLQMEGNIEFYKHAGFDLASKMKIHYHGEPAESEVPYFLAQELIPGYWGAREGTYCPPAGYFVRWPLTDLPLRVTANGVPLTDFDATGCRLPHDFRGTIEATLPYLAPWPREP